MGKIVAFSGVEPGKSPIEWVILAALVAIPIYFLTRNAAKEEEEEED